MSILSIDYGEKRIGLAKSDELFMFAHGIGYIENSDPENVETELKKICEENRISKILVGLPRKMDGELGPAARNVLQFVETIKNYLFQEIIMWDERLSTKGASAFLKESGMKSKKKKEKIDQLAAQVMLQTYLDSQAGGHV